MRRWVLVLLVIVGALFLSGCLHLSRTAPFQYEPIPIQHERLIPTSVGFNLLTDQRPHGDRVRTRIVENLPEKVTAKLAEDLRKQQIFGTVDFPATEKDDVIITGMIKRFSWRAYENPLGYIPLVYLIKITGIPIGLASGVVNIRLEMKDRKTGASLGTVSALSHARSFFNLYELSPDWPGVELGESFRVAEAQLSGEVVSKLRHEWLDSRMKKAEK